MENEAEELKFKRNELKSKAFASLHDASMTPSIGEKFVVILELVRTGSTLTPEQVHNVLYEYIDKSTFAPGSNLDKYSELTNLLKTPKGREEIEARYLLKKAIDSRVIQEKQGAYTWARPTGVITVGETYTEAVEFLMNPKKSSLVEDLENEIKAKNY